MIEYRNIKSKNKKCKRVNKNLSKVNKKVLNLLFESGLKIIISKGQITDNVEIKHYKNTHPRNYPKGMVWNFVQAMHEPIIKTIFIGINGNYYNNNKKDYPQYYNPNRCVILHEIGHNYDDVIGEYFFGKSLSKLKTIKKSMKRNKFEKEYFNKNPREYVANSFDLFYRSKKDRKKLKKEHKEIWYLINFINNEL